MQPAPAVFRFAPSPNGELHLGHAYSVLVNHRMAREAGGQFLLRRLLLAAAATAAIGLKDGAGDAGSSGRGHGRRGRADG